MEKELVKTLTKRIPRITRSYNFRSQESGKGSNHRLFLSCVGMYFVLMLLDLHGSFSTFGFNRTVLRNEYKFRPDYITGSLFMAYRTDVPKYRYF